MRFTKMHGLGNDYVYVDCTGEELENADIIAKYVSDRHFGIGADGLILIKSSEVADFQMEMYNADGSQGAMCGNGIRCVGKFVFDHFKTPKTELSIETKGGIKFLELFAGPDGSIDSVKVNMGTPILEAAEIPLAGYEGEVVNAPITVDGKEYRMTAVSMGNPHAVVYIDDVENLNIEAIGPKFENHEAFPDRVNTEFCKVIDRQTVDMRVWERGSGETMACGTGACAVAVSSILNGLTEDEVTIRLLGGNLKIKWDREENVVYMTGPATTVYEGWIDLNTIPGA